MLGWWGPGVRLAGSGILAAPHGRVGANAKSWPQRHPPSHGDHGHRRSTRHAPAIASCRVLEKDLLLVDDPNSSVTPSDRRETAPAPAPLRGIRQPLLSSRWRLGPFQAIQTPSSLATPWPAAAIEGVPVAAGSARSAQSPGLLGGHRPRRSQLRSPRSARTPMLPSSSPTRLHHRSRAGARRESDADLAGAASGSTS